MYLKYIFVILFKIFDDLKPKDIKFKHHQD